MLAGTVRRVAEKTARLKEEGHADVGREDQDEHQEMRKLHGKMGES